jgi:multidrug resistance protein
MVCLIMGGNGMVAPILSLFAQTFSVGTMLVGFVITSFGIGRLVANFPAGLLSQRFGRRPMLCLGPVLLGIGSIGAALAESFAVLVIWRFVQGVGSGVYMTASAAALADNSSREQVGRVMALYQAALLLGTSVGPALGGWIAASFGFTAPFWAYALVAVAALATALVSFKDASPTPRSPNSPQESSIRVLLGRVFAAICLVSFAIFFTRTASQWLLVPLIASEKHGMGVAAIGIAVAVIAVGSFALLPWAGIIIDRWGSRSATAYSTVLLAVGLVILAIGQSEITFWAAIIIIGIAGGVNGPSIGAYMVEVAPRNLYGPSIGLQRTAGDFGFVLGPLVAGAFFDGLGYTSALGMNAVVLLLSVAVFLLWTPSRTKVD